MQCYSVELKLGTGLVTPGISGQLGWPGGSRELKCVSLFSEGSTCEVKCENCSEVNITPCSVQCVVNCLVFNRVLTL